MEIIWLLMFVLLRVSSDVLVYGQGILVVKCGQEIHLSCPLVSKSNSADWYHISVGSQAQTPQKVNNLIPVFKNSTFSGRNLTILAAQVDHAGLYRCSGFTGESGNITTTEALAAYVVVLTSDPVCEVVNVNVTENQYSWLRCSINYRADWNPVMNWTQRRPSRTLDDVVWMNVTLQENVENNTTTMNSSIRILGQPLKEPLVYECRIFFSSNSCCEANKTLGYNYTWLSPEINVLYGTRDVTITPIKDAIHPGDILICNAIGNPAPEFEWRISGSNIIVSGSRFEVNASMVRQQPYVLSCKAKNSISENVASITVTVQSRGEPPYTIITIAFAVVSIVLIIVATTTCYIISGRKQKKAASLLENNRPTLESVYHEITFPSACVPSPATNNNDDAKLLGEDGTVYLRMNSDAPSPTGSRHFNSSKFEPSNYVSIDHTMKVPKPRSQRMN